MRTLVDIPETDIEKLDLLAAEARRSRAAEIREAIRRHILRKSNNDWIDRGFAIWKDRADIGDAVEWQRRERASSTRPWDDDYEEVRAEFPDLFDEEDDRQRQIHLQMANGSEHKRRARK
jgi:predicted transcriptional regulator